MLRKLQPAITNVGTPKAGLLGGIAALAAGVPCRIYTAHGLRFETARGLRRSLLLGCEYLACWTAHRVLAVSESVRQTLLANRLAPAAKVVVLGRGSCNGVDAEYFDPESVSQKKIAEMRASLGIPEGAPIIGFVGRFTRDKGISVLVNAYEALRRELPAVYLLLVGDFETGDPVDPATRKLMESDAQIVGCGMVNDPRIHYQLMDVVVLPTYREGFPNVVLEAQAAGKVVVTTRATGAIDSIVDGETGLLVEAGDAAALAAALKQLLLDPGRRARMGERGRQWVRAGFQRESVWNALIDEYRATLDACPHPGARSWNRNSVLLCKRALDIIGATGMLVWLAPVMVVVAILIRILMGSPILFRQTRPGRHHRPFSLLKFRTMREDNDSAGRPRPDAVRLTRLGRWLRRSSLDELPQLWNVLRGELSLVGPRPLLMDYLARYTPEQARRHDVLPGMTGWAQIHGRNALSWEEKFALDLWYVDHWSLGLDLRILVLTLWRLLSGAGISQPGHATMPEFTGVGKATTPRRSS